MIYIINVNIAFRKYHFVSKHGVREVAPKQILQVTREKIGSHLQKYRMTLAKEHGVQIKDITNYMCLRNAGEVTRKACEKWREPGYDGETNVNITKILKGM